MAVRVGRYEIVRAIASGGMATVHLARVLGEGGFERLVALKIMHPHIAALPEFVAMFLDEARLAARIRHPNVVATHDVHKGSSGVFLVMDFIDGPSLYALLNALRDRGKLLPLDITLRVFTDALAGLHAAHELRDDAGASLELVHRDVSPDNILLGSDGLARITDFGVARAESRLAVTKSGHLKGKLPFMAPEQVLSGQVDRRSDVYAAGATLWEALAGRRLFEADNEGMLLTQVVVGATRSPRVHGAEIPEAIEAVTMRALSHDPAARFPTAATFAQALDEAARSAGVAIASPSRVAAYLEELKKDGLGEPQSASGDAFVLSVGAHATANGPAGRPGESSARAGGAGRSQGLGRIVALGAGALVIGLASTLVVLLLSAPGAGPDVTRAPERGSAAAAQPVTTSAPLSPIPSALAAAAPAPVAEASSEPPAGAAPGPAPISSAGDAQPTAGPALAEPRSAAAPQASPQKGSALKRPPARTRWRPEGL